MAAKAGIVQDRIVCVQHGRVVNGVQVPWIVDRNLPPQPLPVKRRGWAVGRRGVGLSDWLRRGSRLCRSVVSGVTGKDRRRGRWR